MAACTVRPAGLTGGRAVELVALHVDLDQVAGGDFAVVQAERVDQELRSPPLTLSGRRSVMWL
jgi:hypothetical protein